jgi:hypothetical protein
MNDQESKKIISEFEGKVVALTQPIGMRPGLSRRDAVNSVKLRHPELTQRYLLATNPGARRQRELKERFDCIPK